MTDSQTGAERGEQRSHRPASSAFREFVASGWAQRPSSASRLDVADLTPARRKVISEAFPGERLVLPAGGLKVRSNDTDYVFRPHSAFAHLTGFERDQEPDAILVFEPIGEDEPVTEPPHEGDTAGHRLSLFFNPRAGADTEEFFADSRYGEYWVGPRPTLEDVTTMTGLRAVHRDLARDAVAKDLGSTSVRLVRGADTTVEAWVDTARAQVGADEEASRAGDDEFATALSELRLVKDAYEIERMREAVAITRRGFDEAVAALPKAVGHARGERVVETAFVQAARQDGNGIGYDTIAASGDHATTLHWIRNDGAVRDGEILLLDAGAEHDSLYTADITRSIPVNGRFTAVQRDVYDAVLEAADAAFAEAAAHTQRTVRFRDVHTAAMKVIATRLGDWGLLPVSVDESLSPEGQQHRRWMVHGTSHHLGIDVHDCAQARKEMYLDGILRPGMIFTIEPGLYFKEDDLLIPEEFRGIGVRIEDDVLVTDAGVENLSADFPRTADEIEAWHARLTS